MQSVLTIGIDLPQKALVCQVEAGATFLSDNVPRYLTHRRELGDSAKCVVEAISGALNELAAKATNSWLRWLKREARLASEPH